MLEEALRSRHSLFGVFNDAPWVATNHSERWASLQKSIKCWGDTMRRGGVFLLGPEVKDQNSWKAVDAEGELAEDPTCIAVHPAMDTTNSPAAIYTASAA